MAVGTAVEAEVPTAVALAEAAVVKSSPQQEGVLFYLAAFFYIRIRRKAAPPSTRGFRAANVGSDARQLRSGVALWL